MTAPLTIFKTRSKEWMQTKIDSYFENVKKKKLVASMTGLALHLGCTRKNLVDYVHTDEFGPMLSRAKLMCENVLEEKMILGTPPTGIIFILKNNYGWNDKVEIEGNINHNISLAQLFDQATKKRLLEGTKQEVIDGEITETAVDDNLFEDKDNLINEQEALPADLF